MTIEKLIKSKIRDIPDFPKPGILFKDITPLLQDRETFAKVIDTLAERYVGKKVDVIAGIESRGFIFGAPLAYRLGTSFVPIRKLGKLPYDTVQTSYDLEYGTATIEMHTDSVRKVDRVVIVDDLLATGGTAAAACQLVEKQGGEIVECSFIVELSFLHGKAKLRERELHSLVQY